MGDTVEDILKEIGELKEKVVGKINNLDSNKQKADAVLEALNSIIAGVDLSKVEKAGILAYLMDRRIKG